MKVSQKTDYALRALFVLAQAESAGVSVRTAEIAKREKIPVKFLEAILVELRRSGFVHSQRGAEGGHRLARAASGIKVGDVWRVLDGPLSPVADLDGRKRKGPSVGVFQPVWEDVGNAAAEVVDAVTLEDMVRRAEASRDVLDFNI